ncbi:hypothetical protein QBC37DRAFT_485176 [Rhypophila decipiens]|uniref:Uncharacterized protein n=1 Tax=Rhypophila decipiens TaxID=261697 RepID=A0AAN6Y184_9PEZI|nr:hypothetical protein QBC37DRAFT_485176 [Rhypophila decipiens]
MANECMSFHTCIPRLLFLQVPERCCQIQDYKCTSIIYPPEVLMLLFPLPFYLCICFALALLCHVTGPFIWYRAAPMLTGFGFGQRLPCKGKEVHYDVISVSIQPTSGFCLYPAVLRVVARHRARRTYNQLQIGHHSAADEETLKRVSKPCVLVFAPNSLIPLLDKNPSTVIGTCSAMLYDGVTCKASYVSRQNTGSDTISIYTLEPAEASYFPLHVFWVIKLQDGGCSLACLLVSGDAPVRTATLVAMSHLKHLTEDKKHSRR